MKKEYTPFGKYFSELRKQRKQSITEAAKLLGVSIAYISSVEHGDREIPSDWRKKLIKIYGLNETEIEMLNRAYYDTPSNKKISLVEMERCLINMIENLFEDESERKQMIEKLKKQFEIFRK